MSCSSVKRVAEEDHLLVKNTVHINDKVNNTELINNLLFQRRNRKIAGIPLRLYIYNTAQPNIDSIVKSKVNRSPEHRARLERFLSKKQLERYIHSRISFNKWIKKTGEAPVIIDSLKIRKSERRLEAYYINNGWFNAKASSKVNLQDKQRATVDYFVTTNEPYILDSISASIASPIVDSLYKKTKKNSFIKSGQQYKTANFSLERDRLTNRLRNSGVFHFSQDYVFFEIDTVGTNKKVNVDLQIKDRAIRTQDSTTREPFKIYTVKDVNIFTNTTFETRNNTITDSASHNGFNLYSVGKMRFKPKALTDAIFITPNSVYRDIDRTRSYRHLSNLRTFKYPNIEYIENPDTTLTANIQLTPFKRFGLNFSAEVIQSNIQTVGFSFNPSLIMRNIFRGAETLELSAIGSIGASEDAGDGRDQFFDINEIGVDLKLTIPRLFSPFNTERLIPKFMFPSTRISLATTSQTNIGLDKQTFTGVFNYKWFSSNTVTNRLDVFNIQYVKNLNIANYFGVYQNSYNTLNGIAETFNNNPDYLDLQGNLTFPEGTDLFINDVLTGNTLIAPINAEYQTVSAINERKERLTEDNLIFASNFNYVKDKQESIYDENFSIFRFKLEMAGNVFSAASSILGLQKNSAGRYEILDVAFSQYVKTEVDYVKHWDLGKKNVIAMRSFFGIAIPYGNSTNIPFSKSFFAGGTNDNRAWSAYSLGPGSSESNNEFNEANLKLALSAELRFNVFEDFYGALFIDAGNIWNIFDDVEDDRATFSNFSSLKDVAIGSGVGLRYDFGFAVFRLDTGFKTYEPSIIDGNRWFNKYNFRNAVYNIGINYPF